MRIPALNEILDVLLRWRSDDHDGIVLEEKVDLERYAGRWYEIAAFPKWFEKGCSCTMAEYTYQAGFILVRHSCMMHGRTVAAAALARPVPGTNNSQLRISFRWPSRDHYWIIALDEDYQFAMVGHPSRDYLWILSRSPYMDDATYQSLVKRAKAMGYNVKHLRRTDQSCSLEAGQDEPPRIAA